MRRIIHFFVILVVVALTALVGAVAAVAAPPQVQPLDLPCATNVSAAPLAGGQPAKAPGQALILVRISIGAGGSLGAHTHPGTLAVSIESGTLGFTQISHMAMSVMRSGGAGTPAVAEPVTPGQEVQLGAGDWFVEAPGMVHSVRTIGDEPAVAVFAGLVDPTQPLIHCLAGTPAA